MSKKLQILDCTLRDGAYIVNAEFGEVAIRGLIRKLQAARIDIIECGWLKNESHKKGTTFYHVPADLQPYFLKDDNHQYVVMIDWNRYDLSYLPFNDGKSIDAIRVVFPKEHFIEGIKIGKNIKLKGYGVYFQAANTLEYTDEELIKLADLVNQIKPWAISIVDTFGAMYVGDLERIFRVLDARLDPDIMLGFHSHNNQQLSFALCMRFAELIEESLRDGILDSSLCGMGRGAGNATTELLVNYLNRMKYGNYELDAVLDAIDTFMSAYQRKFSWGYSTPYFIAGMYGAHVNNIAYLIRNHRANAETLRGVISSMNPRDRFKYEYDSLEQKYIDYVDQYVQDEETLKMLKEDIASKCVLLILPGRKAVDQKSKVEKYIEQHNPVIIGVNAAIVDYKYDYIFFASASRYEYAFAEKADYYKKMKRILSSNVKTESAENEFVVSFSHVIKRGWEHYDNAGIMCLRLLNLIGVRSVALAGFDGFSEEKYENNYASSVSLPFIDPKKSWSELNAEIYDMMIDFRNMTKDVMEIKFITDSIYEVD